MLPSFTEHGLLPPGIHDCSLQDAYDYFCTNDHRRRIWDGLLNFIELMKFYGIDRDYIILDGSFVTDKSIPSDIELVFPVDIKTLTKKQKAEQKHNVFTAGFLPGFTKEYLKQNKAGSFKMTNIQLIFNQGGKRKKKFK